MHFQEFCSPRCRQDSRSELSSACELKKGRRGKLRVLLLTLRYRVEEGNAHEVPCGGACSLGELKESGFGSTEGNRQCGVRGKRQVRPSVKDIGDCLKCLKLGWCKGSTQCAGFPTLLGARGMSGSPHPLTVLRAHGMMVSQHPLTG